MADEVQYRTQALKLILNYKHKKICLYFAFPDREKGHLSMLVDFSTFPVLVITQEVRRHNSSRDTRQQTDILSPPYLVHDYN